MKKFFFLIFSCIMCITIFVGCSNKPSEDTIEFEVIESQAFHTSSVEKISAFTHSKYYMYFPVLTNSIIDEYEISARTTKTFDKVAGESSNMKFQQFALDKDNSIINKEYKDLFYSLIKIDFYINDMNAVNKTKGIEIYEISIFLNSNINLHYILPVKILFIDNQEEEVFINMEATKMIMLANIKNFIELYQS